METNYQCSSTEKNEQILCNLGVDPHGSGHVKSYTCAFCKRGFSNAQALGGHMNIHRKDRAKLKQASDEILLSLDITRSSSLDPLESPQDSHEEKSLFVLESSEERSMGTLKRSFSLSAEDDVATPRNKSVGEEPQPLPFFVDKKVGSCPGVGDEEKKMELSTPHGASHQVELDLELRLGPEPNETSTSSTKEFF